MPKEIAVQRPRPSLQFELPLWRQGLGLIAGIDEVGRGALAGPVYAAAVILPARKSILRELDGVRDSKQMRRAEREAWAPIIQEKALGFAIGKASCREIDRIGIAPATRLAAKRAVLGLGIPPQHLLVDYLRLQELDLPQSPIVGGDALCLSIAAASVVAKVARDAELCKLDRRFPLYGFAAHKGYATEAHRSAIEQYGPCAQHRRSFAPVRLQ
ncbi:MAG: ribonuclease HII [Anaerolineales bacterium]|nr:ribonuclease HII [Anaerolineales bacterium]MCW5855681.1 ribonuclease HII [Anaerolineales bacterium]